MFEYNKLIIDVLEYMILYPPEGESSILEVAEKSIGPFLHVMLAADESLVFAWFPEKLVCLTEDHLTQIAAKARKNLSLTDIRDFES